MEYTFWKLLRAQWSWNNDKYFLLEWAVFCFLCEMIMWVFGVYTIESSGNVPFLWYVGLITLLYFIKFSTVLLFYHTVKLILFSLFCYLIVNGANQGNLKDIDRYNEMMTWRQ